MDNDIRFLVLCLSLLKKLTAFLSLIKKKGESHITKHPFCIHLYYENFRAFCGDFCNTFPSINKKSYSLRNNSAACRDRRYNPHRGSRPGRNHPDRH